MIGQNNINITSESTVKPKKKLGVTTLHEEKDLVVFAPLHTVRFGRWFYDEATYGIGHLSSFNSEPSCLS